jgi:hypothetical protein
VLTAGGFMDSPPESRTGTFSVAVDVLNIAVHAPGDIDVIQPGQVGGRAVVAPWRNPIVR